MSPAPLGHYPRTACPACGREVAIGRPSPIADRVAVDGYVFLHHKVASGGPTCSMSRKAVPS